MAHMGFAKTRGSLLNGPLKRIIELGVLYWDPTVLGNY